MNTITRIQISRCSSIFGNRLAALIHLNEYTHSVGQPVMVRYTDENGKTDTITAIGVKSGVGKDCYSIISYGQEGAVGGVFFDELPDVSSLVHDVPYLAPLNGVWCVFYIDGSGTQRQVKELSDGDKFYSLSDSHMYYFNGSRVFRDDKEIDLLNDKFELLSHGKLSVELYHSGTLKKTGESINRPLLDISVLDANGIDLTLDCDFSVVDEDGLEVPCEILNEKLLLATEINTTKTYTITASYTNSIYEDPITGVGEIKFNFVDPIKYGVVGGNEQEILWNGEGSLDLVFNLNKQKSYLKIPASYPSFNHIFDVHGLDYIADYKITRIGDIVTYEKLDAVTINNFIQKFTR